MKSKKQNLGYKVDVRQKEITVCKRNSKGVSIVGFEGDHILHGTLELRKIPGKNRTEARRNAQKFVKNALGIEVTVEGAWVEKPEYWL